MDMSVQNITICPEYLKPHLLHKSFVEGSTLDKYTSLSRELTKYSSNTYEDIFLLLNLSHLLKQNHKKFNIYKDLICNYQFLSEVLQFAREMILYGIDNIPDDEYHPKELSMILEYALTLPLIEKDIILNIDKTNEELKSQNITFAPSFESNYFRYKIKEQFISNNKNDKKIIKSLHKALNIHKEIEGSIKDSLKHFKNGETCAFILCEPSSQLPIIETILNTYKIPFSYTNKKEFTRITKVFSSLVNFMMTPNSRTLLTCLKENAFNTNINSEVITILERQLVDINLLDIDASLKETQEIINNLLKEKEYTTILKNAYNLISSSKLLSDKNEMAVGNKIGKALQVSLPLIEDDKDVILLLDYIETLTATTNSFKNDKCIVTDLVHPVLNYDYIYVLGASEKNYPGFSPRNGIFDEQYVETIPSFPSIQERKEAFIRELEWLDECANKEILYSYYTNSYDKHEQNLSFTIQEAINQSEKDAHMWDLPITPEKEYAIHKLPKNLSKELFTKGDDKDWYIPSSISSIEKWYKCPYQYFLSKGLHLGSKDDELLAANTIGSIMHSCMENYDKGRTLEKKSKKELLIDNERLITEEIEKLRIEWPNSTVQLDITKERLIAAINKSISSLQKFNDMKAYTIYHNSKKEYDENNNFSLGAEFKINELNNNTRYMHDHLAFSGSIDRLNEKPSTKQISVIDYKSSTKTLSQTNIENGTQLQLLTYLIIAILYIHNDEIVTTSEKAKLESINTILDKYGMAVFYYSLKEDNIVINKYRTTSKINPDISPTSPNYIDFANEKVEEKRKLRGKSFVRREDDEDISNTIRDKRGEFSFPLSNYYELLRKVYAFFVEDLVESDKPILGINTLPNDDITCSYCDYSKICRYHGEKIKRSPVVEMDNLFKTSGNEEEK